MSTPTPMVSDWSIVVLARGEAAMLARCLEAIGIAAAGHAAQVTVLLAGAAAASAAVAEGCAAATALPLRLYGIPHGDRANVWNQYVHALRPAAALHVFLDAHVAMVPGALRALAATLAAHPGAEAATALPSIGRDAPALRAWLRSGGALHGPLHALRGRFLDAVAARGLRLPVGFEAIHPVVAGLLGDRIVVAEEATWRPAPQPWCSPRRAWNRRIRQARAQMEAAALAEAGVLPACAAPLLRDWLARHPASGGVFDWQARRRLAAEAPPPADALLPRRLEVARSPRASAPRPAPAA